MVNATMPMPFNTLLMAAQSRHEDLNPVDRQTQIGRLRFILANPEQVEAEDFTPTWGLTSPALESIPPTILFSDHAIKQFVNVIDYKASLLVDLRPDYVFNDINFLMSGKHSEKASFLRLIHGNEETITARAFMGGRFTPLDDLELLNVAAEYLEGSVVRFHGFDSLSSHFTVTWPDQVREDGLEPALHIANSECGVRSVTIQAALFRTICTNVLPRIDMMGDLGFGKDGTIYERTGEGNHSLNARRGTVAGGFRFIHVGNADKLRGFVRDAISDISLQHETMFAEWDQGLNVRIDDPAKAMEHVARMSKLAKDDLHQVLNAHGEEMEASGRDFANTATGIANAFTRAANWQQTIERRYELQMAGARAFKALT